MSAVRRAIHIRTGAPAAVDAVDGWLHDHGVEVVALIDAYDACVHLLRRYDQVAELALVGSDWLGAQEFRIVHYLRQTWPQIGVVLYGSGGPTPAVDWGPLTLTCPTDAALRELLAQSPTSLFQRLTREARTCCGGSTGPAARRREPAIVPTGRPKTPLPRVTPVRPPAPRKLVKRTADPERPSWAGASARLTIDLPDPPRATLTAEELSALLDASDDE